MYYVLMALNIGPMCGVDAADWIARRTAGRIQVGPATLYTILAKFEKEHFIAEFEVDGRRRTYIITPEGRAAYAVELARLRRCVADAEAPALGDLVLPSEADVLRGVLPAGYTEPAPPDEGRLTPCPTV